MPKAFTPQLTADPLVNRNLDAIAAAIADLAASISASRSEPEVTTTPGSLRMTAATIFVDYRGISPGGHTVVLPPADVVGRGRSRPVYVLNNSSFDLTVAANAKNTVNGVTSLSIGASNFFVLVSDGDSKWSAG